MNRAADRFFADLVGETSPRQRRRLPPLAPIPYPVAPRRRPPDRDATDFAEAVPQGGRGAFRFEPLGGVAGDNVAARWNVDASTAPGTTIDIVVYLHGYSSLPDDARFLPQQAAAAGLDMLASDGTVSVRASRPTLALIPRGRNLGDRAWVFDRLDRAEFDRLIQAALLWLCTTVLGQRTGATLRRGRLTLAAHSGGGAGMNDLLKSGVNPDELLCFDSTYGTEVPIQEWALARIGSADAARSGMRVFYGPCYAPDSANPAGRWVQGRDGTYHLRDTGSWSYRSTGWQLIATEVHARRLHEAIRAALARTTGGAALESRFRVQRTSVPHDDIPKRYAPLLLENIAVDVKDAVTPPLARVRPACVANPNDEWLKHAPLKPGGTDAPPPKPTPAPTGTTGQNPAADAPAKEDVYAPPGSRTYSPSTDASLFRTPPDPVGVTPATEWPAAASNPGDAVSRALGALGVSADRIRGFGPDGMAALNPIAAVFGEAAFGELLRRLRYSSARLANPPTSFDREADLTRAFGRPVGRGVILAIRTLLAIPGHFRELARRAPSEDEAFAIEILGWLLMHAVAAEVRTASGIDFWLPASPAFVTRFATGLTALAPQTAQLVAARSLADASVDAAAYRTRFTAWQSGAPGRMWRLETGRDTSQGGAARAPFYADPFTIPASINIAAERAQVRRAWTHRVADVDAGRTTVPLTDCASEYLTRLGLMAPISLRGVQLRAEFPSPASRSTFTALNGLAAVRPAFEAAFQAVADLGWNDLLVETQGMGCFRGKKIPGRPEAARQMSEHSLGIAVDLNVFENEQNIAGSMDPRIVALFEAFRFRWGKGFPTPDPMHFEYAG